MNILSALHKDHETIKDLLDRLTQDGGVELEQRMALVEDIREVLIPHLRAEEAVFYNSLRIVGDVKVNLNQEYWEHVEVETLLHALRVKDKLNVDWLSTAMKLKDAVERHVKEEESKIFPLAKRYFTKQEINKLGKAFMKLKPQIKEEGTLQTSVEMLTNVMPQRFVPESKSLNLHSRI